MSDYNLQEDIEIEAENYFWDQEEEYADCAFEIEAENYIWDQEEEYMECTHYKCM